MTPIDTLERPYRQADVERLRGTVTVEHTLARLGAERLRKLLAEDEWVPALGAMTGGQAVQMVKAGLRATPARPADLPHDAGPRCGPPPVAQTIHSTARGSPTVSESQRSGGPPPPARLVPAHDHAPRGWSGPATATSAFFPWDRWPRPGRPRCLRRPAFRPADRATSQAAAGQAAPPSPAQRRSPATRHRRSAAHNPAGLHSGWPECGARPPHARHESVMGPAPRAWDAASQDARRADGRRSAPRPHPLATRAGRPEGRSRA